MVDVLKVVIWPLAVVVLVVFFGIYFRKQLGALLERTTSLGKGGLQAAEPRVDTKNPPGTTVLEGVGDISAISRGVRFFISTPLSGIGTQDDYDAFMERMKPVVAKIRSLRFVEAAYYFNEYFPSIDYSFEERFSVPDYLNQIDQSDYLIVIINTASVSGVYWEAGYALGKGIKAIHFVGPSARLPHLMKQSAFTYPKLVRFQTFTRLEEIPELLRQIMPALQNEEPGKRLMMTN